MGVRLTVPSLRMHCDQNACHSRLTQAIEATVDHMDTFAKEGLRTLLVAQAELEPAAYEGWASDFEEVGSEHYSTTSTSCRKQTFHRSQKHP